LRPLLARSRWCSGIVESDLMQADPGAAIRQAVSDTEATHVVPDTVSAFVATADVAPALAPTLPFPSPSPALLRVLDNKYHFGRLARTCGLPIVDHVLVTDANPVGDHGLGYPVLVKPLETAGGEGIRLCRTAEDLARVLAASPRGPQLVERYVAGGDVHFTFLADHGELVAWEAHEPNPSARLGYRACRFFDDAQALAIGRSLADATEYCGVANLDFRRDGAGRLWLLECNPRLYDRLGVATKAGVNFVGVGLDLADGRRPRRPVFVPHDRVVYSPFALGAAIRALRPSDAGLALTSAVEYAVSDPSLSFSMAWNRLRLHHKTQTAPAA
jgi:predicted ATP-grasp superfamily ATP-dependent carboligase